MKKVVFVLGGSSGIGLAAINLFIKEGYIVYNGSRNPCPNAKVKNFEVDVTNIDTIKNAIESIIKIDHKIDLLIYSAGFSMASQIEMVKEIDYRYLFDVNFFGVIETLKLIVPIMKEQGGGKIQCISSIGSTIPIAFDPYYSSSKAALDMLCFDTRFELEKHNIWISSMLLGGTKTDFSFKRKIYNKMNDEDNIEKAVASLYKTEQNGMTANAVAKTIFRISKRKRPPIKVATGFSNKMIIFISKIFSDKMMLKILRIKYFK